LSKGVLEIPSRVIAVCFGLVAFAIALVMGLAVGNEPVVILQRAILAMLGCMLVGWVVGVVAQRAVQDRIDAYKKENPLPLERDQEQAAGAAQPVKPGEQPNPIVSRSA
jgi:hypothetical protein